MGIPIIPASSRLRSRPAIISLFALISILFLISVPKPSSHQVLHSLSPVKLLYPSTSPSEPSTSSSETLDTLSQLYEDERVALLTAYDQTATEALVRSAPGGLNPDFNDYISRLESFVERYFKHSIYHADLIASLTRMVNARPPVEAREFEKHIFSFDKGGPEGVPDEFDWWNRRLSHRGWRIEVGDDAKMEQWFEQSAGQQPEMLMLDEEEALYSGKARWEELWHGLGRPVLKSDLLRYLMTLIKGGMYTDSDTSVLSDPNLWGTHAHDLTPRGLVALQRAMRHLDPSHPSSQQRIPSLDLDEGERVPFQQALEHQSEVPPPIEPEPQAPEPYAEPEAQYFPPSEPEVESHEEQGQQEPDDATPLDILEAELEDQRIDESRFEGVQRREEMAAEYDYASNPIKPASRGINNPDVAMVVAVEYDVHHERQDPRFGYTRDLQIVQWTFMAKPHHPVFLDVLETATTEIMKRRLEGNAHNNWQSILDVTGPGPFTDALLRYLLIQYGVQPQELIGMEDGALVGDVLILPLHAFGSYLGGENDWNAHDPSTRCTAHGFRGRWKGDMDFQKRSRVERR